MLFWMRFGRVWGTVFGAFWTILGGFWVLKRRPILKPKLEAEKVISRPREGRWPGVGREVAGGSGGPNNDR